LAKKVNSVSIAFKPETALYPEALTSNCPGRKTWYLLSSEYVMIEEDEVLEKVVLEP
jgi:hypothetical protein